MFVGVNMLSSWRKKRPLCYKVSKATFFSEMMRRFGFIFVFLQKILLMLKALSFKYVQLSL